MLRRKQQQDVFEIEDHDFDPFEEMPEPEPLDDFDFDRIADRYERKFEAER